MHPDLIGFCEYRLRKRTTAMQRTCASQLADVDKMAGMENGVVSAQ
jgi:hypothetical protein